jgi:hypothetical protein
MVPRRAVRRIGPRPDLTRSTHIGELEDEKKEKNKNKE